MKKCNAEVIHIHSKQKGRFLSNSTLFIFEFLVISRNIRMLFPQDINDRFTHKMLIRAFRIFICKHFFCFIFGISLFMIIYFPFFIIQIELHITNAFVNLCRTTNSIANAFFETVTLIVDVIEIKSFIGIDNAEQCWITNKWNIMFHLEIIQCGIDFVMWRRLCFILMEILETSTRYCNRRDNIHQHIKCKQFGEFYVR